MTPKISRQFGWNTPASRKLIRAVAQYALIANHRDSLDLGPDLVEANAAQRAANKAMDIALGLLITELREELPSYQTKAIKSSDKTEAP